MRAVLGVANKVNRVEVGSRLHHLHIFLVFGVYLIALENLWRCSAVGIIGDKRTTASLSFFFHHTAHAQGTIEFCLYVIHHILAVK